MPEVDPGEEAELEWCDGVGVIGEDGWRETDWEEEEVEEETESEEDEWSDDGRGDWWVDGNNEIVTRDRRFRIGTTQVLEPSTQKEGKLSSIQRKN